MEIPICPITGIHPTIQVETSNLVAMVPHQPIGSDRSNDSVIRSFRVARDSKCHVTHIPVGVVTAETVSGP